MPQCPTPEAKFAAMLRRAAILEGHKPGALPEVGVRISIKPTTVRAIRRMAAEGMHCAAIARALKLKESGVRRYAKDYDIALPKGDPGGPGKDRLEKIKARRQLVIELLDQGLTQRAIAKKLECSTYTINRDAQYMLSRRRRKA